MKPAVKEALDNLIGALSAEEYGLDDLGKIQISDFETKRVVVGVIPRDAVEAVKGVVHRLNRF